MFKNILVPTEGSALAGKAIDTAIAFAKVRGARIVALSVAEPYPFAPLAESSITMAPEIYDANMRELAQQHVPTVLEAASKGNVQCETVVRQSFHPYEEIIDVARKYNCDVVFMASHGRKGLTRLFAGSETQRMLLHSTIPVLVLR